MIEIVEDLFTAGSPSESDVRRWIKRGRDDAAAAERKRVREALLKELLLATESLCTGGYDGEAVQAVRNTEWREIINRILPEKG